MSKTTTALQEYVDTKVAAISPFKVKSLELQQKAANVIITDTKTAKEAVAVKKEITSHKTSVKNARLDVTRRFDDIKDQFIAAEKDVLKPAEEAQANITQKIFDFEAEQERIRLVEEQRLQAITLQFDTNVRAIRSMKGVTERGAEVKDIFGKLPKKDQENPIVKLAFTETINSLLSRKDELRTAEVDEAEQAHIEAKRARDQEVAQAEADQLVKVAARSRPKTGVKIVKKFVIINPDLVPRNMCVPSDQLIRQQINSGATEIPGVTITEERSF